MHAHPTKYEVVILGAGYAGLMAGLRLSAWSCPIKALLISEYGTFTERVRLQEALAGPVEPRLPPFGQWLRETRLDFLQGRVIALDPRDGMVILRSAGQEVAVFFERCIYALGSATRVDHVPGAAEHAFCLDPGADRHAAAALRRRLQDAPNAARVVIVGGGNTAVEAAAQIKASRPDFSVMMIAAHCVGDFGKGDEVKSAVRAQLDQQEILLVDDDPIREVGADHVSTSSGRNIASDVCVLAGGLQSPAIAKAAGIAIDEANRIWVDGGLRSVSHPRILAVGDAARPLAPTGAFYRPSAFAALTSGAYAARSLVRQARGKSYRPFSFSAFGQGVAIGSGGIGFATFPDDRGAYFIFTGPLALRLRNFFVHALVWFLRIERWWPGLAFFWIGRRRVAWSEADAALTVRGAASHSPPDGPKAADRRSRREARANAPTN